MVKQASKNELSDKISEDADDTNVIKKVPSDNVELDINFEDDLKSDSQHDTSCDISGEKLEPGDFIIIFSDDLNPNISMDKMFNKSPEDDDTESLCDTCDDNKQTDMPKMPMGLIPAILQAISDGTVVASPINYFTKYAMSNLYTVPSYQVAKISDCTSYDDAMTTLYNNIHTYNVLREAFVLDTMLSK